MIIRTGLLVTGTGAEIAGGWLRTRDSFIVEVGSGEPPAANEVLDARNCVAVPGLVRASSGSDQAAAERERGKLFREAAARPGGLTPELLFALHRTHRPEKGPLSICMHREEAVTVSLSLIMVIPSLVRFRYVDGSPCEAGPGTEITLSRLATAGDAA